MDMGYRKTLAWGLAITSVSLLLNSCALFSKDLPVEEPKEEPRYLLTAVGQVNSYEKESGIILVRTYGKIGEGEGTAFISSGPSGSSGNLKFTGQKNHLFAAAELQTGTLEPGDLIYRRRLNPAFNHTATSKEEQDAIILEPKKEDTPFEGVDL